MQEKGKPISVDLFMYGREPDEEVPQVAVYRIGPAGRPEEKLGVAKAGKLELQPEWQKRAWVVGLGPDVEDLKELRPASLLKYRLPEVWEEWSKAKIINLPRDWWTGWLFHKVCVSGRVRACFLFGKPHVLFDTIRELYGSLPPFEPPAWHPKRFCRPVCLGVVEVYEHVCCCRPWIELDPRLEDLMRRLREIVRERIPWPFPWPPPPWPEPRPEPWPEPRPGPKPGPQPGPLSLGERPPDAATRRRLKLAEATLDRAAVKLPPERLAQDLRTLECLPREEACRYVLARPYLHVLVCTCTTRKLGEAHLQPDGTFTFCYWRPARVVRIGRLCNTWFTVKVRQWQENQWVEIYNGTTAHDYFARGEFMDITTYDWRAEPCPIPDEPPFTHPKPFVMLYRIGTTESRHLISPMQSNENGINAALGPPAGLVFPPPSPRTSAVWQSGDAVPYHCPWALTLELRLTCTEGMKALGARYYRISVVEANEAGNPEAGHTPKPLVGPISWRKWTYTGGKWQREAVALGPKAVGNESGLYLIPYLEPDPPGGELLIDHSTWQEQWTDPNSPHALWNTREEVNRRHLVIVEVFDQNGDRLKPTGAPGTGTAAAFDFLHWQWSDADPADGVRTPVPFAKLVNVFWTDNLPCFADIEDLRKDGVKSVMECQFLSGPEDTTFSAGFRAYHRNGPSGESFMWRYRLWWHRGLNGPVEDLEWGGTNAPSNPDAASPQESNSQTFGHMLADLETPKCTFALNLDVDTKHTNGEHRRLLTYDRNDQASFALEIPPAP